MLPAILQGCRRLGLVALVLAVAGPAAADHRPALPAPRAAESLLLDIARAGERLVAVGERGHILISDDHGGQWAQMAVPVDAMLTAVHFATPQLGWAVGHDGLVLHSDDGGQHWQLQYDGLAAARAASETHTPPLLDVWFADRERGWAVGAFGTLLHTADGGRHWQERSADTDNPEGLHLNAVTGLADGTLIIAGERGLLWRSTDAGASWQAVDLGYEGSLFGALGDGRQLLVFGLRGHAFRSDDGGAHWRPLPLPLMETLAGGHADAGRVLLVGQGGTVLAGDWGERPFAIRQQHGRHHLSGAAPAADGHWWLVGQGGLHRLPGEAP